MGVKSPPLGLQMPFSVTPPGDPGGIPGCFPGCEAQTGFGRGWPMGAALGRLLEVERVVRLATIGGTGRADPGCKT